MSGGPREVVVLCGGQGTRLRRHDPERPKILVPLAGRPFLVWQLEWLRRLGARRAVLATGFRADQIGRWLRHHAESLPVEVAMVTEPRPLGTAGAVRHVLDTIRGDAFFVTNGDTLLPELRREGDLASDSGAVVMVAVSTDSARTGGRLRLEGNRVVAIERATTSGPAWINGGFYRFERRQVEAWPSGVRSIEKEVFPDLAARGELLAHRTNPPLLDMGTVEGWREMSDHLLNQQPSRPSATREP